MAGVYKRLPAEEWSRSCIFTGNYGETGAIDFFGSAYDLPKAISGHNNYYVWGPRGFTGEAVISVGVPREDLETAFESFEQKAKIECEYCMPNEDDLPGYVSRNSKVPLQEMWPQVKYFD